MSNSNSQEKCQQRERKSGIIDQVKRASPTSKCQDSSPQTQGHISKVKLLEINSYLTCHICKGYLIDATTISECLHSFCRSCIIKFLQDNSFCPVCDVIINKAKPNLKLDKTLQDIVYKLVPGLFMSEMLRRRGFYAERPEEAERVSPEQRGEDTERTIYNPKDSISLSLEYIGDAATSKRIIGDLQNNLDHHQKHPDPKSKTNPKNPEESLLKRYLQCPGMCRIDIIKKFICNKYNVNTDLFQIDVLYKRVPLPLPDHYTLIDVAYIYTWKRNEPMRFYFRIIEKGNDEPPDLTKIFTPTDTPPMLRTQPLSTESNLLKRPITPDEKDRKKRYQKKTKIIKKLSKKKEKLDSEMSVFEFVSSDEKLKKEDSDNSIEVNTSPQVKDNTEDKKLIVTKEPISTPEKIPLGDKVGGGNLEKSPKYNDNTPLSRLSGSLPEKRFIKKNEKSKKNDTILHKFFLVDKFNKGRDSDNDKSTKLNGNQKPGKTKEQLAEIDLLGKIFDFVDETLPPDNEKKNDSVEIVIKKEPDDEPKIASPRGKASNVKWNNPSENVIKKEEDIISMRSNIDKNIKISGDHKVETKKGIALTPVNTLNTELQLEKTPDKDKKPSAALNQPRKSGSNGRCSKLENLTSNLQRIIATAENKNVSLKSPACTNKKGLQTPKAEVSTQKESADSETNCSRNISVPCEEDKDKFDFLNYFGLLSSNLDFRQVKEKEIESSPNNSMKKPTPPPSITKPCYSRSPPAQATKVGETLLPKTTTNIKRKNSSPVKNDSKKTKLVKVILQPKMKPIPKATPGETQDKNKLHALFQNCRLNIPSSLSITLKENDETSRKPGQIPPVQNYIEILKIDEKEGVKTSTPQREEQAKLPSIDGIKPIETSQKIPESTPTLGVVAGSSTVPNESQQKTPAFPKNSNSIPTDSLNKSKELSKSQQQQQSFQKIFEESIKKSEHDTTPDVGAESSSGSNKRNILEIAQQLFKKTKIEQDSPKTVTQPAANTAFVPPKNSVTSPINPTTKVAIPRLNNQRVVKPPKRNHKYDSLPNQTLTNLHSSSLGLNYTVSVGKQSKNPVQQTYKVNGVLSPQSCTSNKTNIAEGNKKSPTNDKPCEKPGLATSPMPPFTSPVNIPVKSSPVSPKIVDLKIPSSQTKIPKVPHSPKPNIASSAPKTEHGSLPPVKSFTPKTQSQNVSQSSPKAKSSSPKLTQSAGSSSVSSTSPPTLTPNQLLEKYNIQNLAQLSASINFNSAAVPQNFLNGNQIAALHHSMFVKQLEMQNRQKWLNINQGILQFEKYLQSLNVSTNQILSNIKDN